MLEELRLRGLGVIADATLEFGPGFTVITGETGAGKTMLLTGLGLVLGERADAGAVRMGETATHAEARFRVVPDGPVALRAVEAGGSLDDDALIVGRTVNAEGRSRAFVGGRSAPAGLLGELREDLIAVHGQADQRGLLRPSTQRQALDRFGGAEVAEALERYRALFRELGQVRAELVEVTTRSRERAREADLLRFGIAEIESAAPQAGEDRELRTRAARLAHVDALRVAARGAHVAITGAADDALDAMALVSDARRSLDDVRGRDEELDGLADRLAEVSYLLSDVGSDLAGYEQRLDADPVALETAQSRLAQLGALCRKYGDDVDAVLRWAEDARARLADLVGDDERVAALTARHTDLLAELGRAASELSAARGRAATALAAAATAELGALALPNARLEIGVAQRDDPQGLQLADGRTVAFGPSGVDDVEIRLVPHAGAAARGLHRGASGGELSRVMLALEVVLAGTDPVPTFVFDEVDAGIGGTAAVEVGRRLATLARTAQVIVVTHLPQVAAFADRHLVVLKTDDGDATTATVRPVEAEARLEELTRMLAGLPDSVHGRGHAEELLAAAGAAKTVPT